jgi:DNA polymerase-4/DNA polymerase V
VRRIGEDGDDDIGSIIKSHTFRPTRDRSYLLSQLAKNLEAACAKARRYRMKARLCRFYLKTQAFTYQGITLDLQVSINEPREFLRAIESRFDDIYEPGVLYRASGIGLYALTREDAVMQDLFGVAARVDRDAPLLGAIDYLNHKYGRHTVFLGESFDAIHDSEDERASHGVRLTLPVHQRKKTISIPHLGVVR